MAVEDFVLDTPSQFFSEAANTTGQAFDPFFSGSVPGASGGVPGGSSFIDSAGKWVGDVVSGLGKEFTGSPLSALSKGLGLGATGLGIANTLGAMNQQQQNQGAVKQGQQMAFGAAQPAIAYGKEQVDAASKGQLPAPMEAAVAQWKQQAKADMQQKLAHLGITDSTAQQTYLEQIDLMGESMKANLLQQEGSGGVAALQAGGGLGLQAGQVGQQQQQLLTSLIAQANQQLGLNAARSTT